MDAPSWLNDGEQPSMTVSPAPSTPAPSAPAPEQSTPPPPSSAPAAAPSPMAPVEDEKDLPKIIMLMRLTNMGIAALVITVSILEVTSIPGISTWILAVYSTCGGILVCCLETQLKFLRTGIAMNFGFLFSSGLRFLFYILLAMITYMFGVFGKVVSGCLIGVSVFNTYVLCKYPSYRAVRERAAQEEDARLNARIQTEARKAAVRSIQTPGGRAP